MANREQRKNREKKKPKQAKAPTPAKTSVFAAPPGKGPSGPKDAPK